ncbi:MAG TPA: efflux RND transporter periplasmic adaptor subunit [Candidatus Binataceae bacterium]|nr:efflux RND transporter periplasmic adaptor subunit [Candidatus Binataceae bacterium]
MEEDPREYQTRAPGRVFFAGWIGAIALVVVATAGLVLARDYWVGRQTSELARQEAMGPHVLVAQVMHRPTTREVKLPGTLRGFDETDIFAKIPGYMTKINVDKGDRIRQGQVLAIIDSPETDQQVANARANYNLAVVTDRRDKTLVDNGVISQQDYDNQHANLLQAKATLQQELALQKYEVVTAPFDGIVSARYADPGHLVPQSTSGASTDSAILQVARMRPLRLFAYMPQSSALFIRNGDHSTFQVNEYPKRTFDGTVARHPQALAADSRTMIVEVDLPNEDLALYPGMYGFVTFTVSTPQSSPMVPDDALIFRNNKTYVPVVRDNRLHLQEVKLGYDNGVAVEVTSGDVTDTDQVALNVGQAARDGQAVQPVRQSSAVQ